MRALNVNEKQLVEELLTRALGECLEVELLAADSQFESQSVFDLLESHKIGSVIAWRRLKGRENPPDVLTVKDRIDVEGPGCARAKEKERAELLAKRYEQLRNLYPHGRASDIRFAIMSANDLSEGTDVVRLMDEQIKLVRSRRAYIKDSRKHI